MLFKRSGPPSRLHPHIDLQPSLDNDCSTWLLIFDWWLHDEKLQNKKICNHEPHKNREMAILLLAPPFMSALSASLQRETELHPQRWSNGQPYYLSLGKECPWMWPKFSEYNNKYLKCLATVRLINKLFTTPQYIEEKLLVVLLGALFQSTSKSFRHTHQIALLSTPMSMVETLRFVWLRSTKWSHEVLEKIKLASSACHQKNKN
jgi:hypothetical protein